MKQSITIKQWDELTLKQEVEFVNSLEYDFENYDGEVTIGEMIEFLGIDLIKIIPVENQWCVFTKGCDVRHNSLVDALWDSCINKLTNPNKRRNK